MMKIILAIAAILVASEASAATNPQTITAGFPFPVYVNGTGTSQSITSGNYDNQTQYTTGAGTTSYRSLTGAGK